MYYGYHCEYVAHLSYSSLKHGVFETSNNTNWLAILTARSTYWLCRQNKTEVRIIAQQRHLAAGRTEWRRNVCDKQRIFWNTNKTNDFKDEYVNNSNQRRDSTFRRAYAQNVYTQIKRKLMLDGLQIDHSLWRQCDCESLYVFWTPQKRYTNLQINLSRAEPAHWVSWRTARSSVNEYNKSHHHHHHHHHHHYLIDRS